MACPDCFKNCAYYITDNCVEYTGEDIPLLGICTGDQLSKIERIIIEKLLGILDGTGLTLSDVTMDNCPFIIGLFGSQEKTLSNILNTLVQATCTLRSLITSISPDPFAFDTVCLTGLPANPNRDQILQAALILLCSIKTTVDAIPSTYVKLTDLNSLVTNIVNNIVNPGGGGTTPPGATAAKLLPYVAYEYYGSLANFDNTGKGIAVLGFDKVYLCNGAYGTPDKRGRVAVGAIRNVPGASLDPAVDPLVNPLNPNWNLNDKGGTNFETLTIPQIPAHTHGITDPGHKHEFEGVVVDGRGGDGSKMSTPATKEGYSATTGITINSTGGGQPHNNIQPTIAANYIMYIP